VDAIVFTGGIGEHDGALRDAVASALSFAGVQIAPESNRSGEGDREISTPTGKVRVYVIVAREDQEILTNVLRLPSGRP